MSDADATDPAASLASDIRQAIELILLGTKGGKRVMDPDFGARIDLIAFEPITPHSTQALRERVRDTLTNLEPRIEVSNVDVEPHLETNREHDEVLVRIMYCIRSTKERCNIVVPIRL